MIDANQNPSTIKNFCLTFKKSQKSTIHHTVFKYLTALGVTNHCCLTMKVGLVENKLDLHLDKLNSVVTFMAWRKGLTAHYLPIASPRDFN